MKRKHRVKIGNWRVYRPKFPMDFAGERFVSQSKAKASGGWFFIKCGGEARLYVRVHGLESAQAICRQLNRGDQAKFK